MCGFQGHPTLLTFLYASSFPLLFPSALVLKRTHLQAFENCKDIIACGFDITKTFIFSDMDYISYLYPNACKLQRAFTLTSIVKTFGFKTFDNMGKYVLLSW